MKRPNRNFIVLLLVISTFATMISHVVATEAITSSNSQATSKNPQVGDDPRQQDITQQAMKSTANAPDTSQRTRKSSSSIAKRSQQAAKNTTRAKQKSVARTKINHGERKPQSSPRSQQPPATTTTAQQPFETPSLAQVMRVYNNTPPLLLTPTRDLYVDVGSQLLGATITKMSAVDLEGDRLEYSLKPANLHDASPYFSIDPATGELKLAHKQLVFQQSEHHKQPSPSGGKQHDNATSSSISDIASGDESDDDEDGGEGDSDAKELSDEQALAPTNLYFLNVAADDGRYTNVVELQVHVINSSAPQQMPLTLEAARVSGERLVELINRKSAEFYDNLHVLPPNNATRSVSLKLAHPNFVNPSIVMPRHEQQDNQLAETTTAPLTSTSFVGSPEDSASMSADAVYPPSVQGKNVKMDELRMREPEQLAPNLSTQPMITPMKGSSDEPPPFMSQSMTVALVVVSSALIISLVLLMFIVPLSVKRLRKRLKHVELQHEHLSQNVSTNGSSTICSSSTGGSVMTHDHNQHHHHRHHQQQHKLSLSQFTLGSDRTSCPVSSNSSSVCRQSSLDSTVSQQTSVPTNQFPINQPLNRQQARFDGSIANPVYLHREHQQQQFFNSIQYIQQQQQQQPQQVHNIQNQAFLLPTNTECHLPALINQQPNVKNATNVYYPIDDDFYSTIDTESTGLDLNAPTVGSQNRNLIKPPSHPPADALNFITQYQPTADSSRPIDSPTSDSGSSTRSLARFLSLPARHSAHAAHQQQVASEEPSGQQASDINNFDDPLMGLPVIPVAKTIARSSHIAREQSQKRGNKYNNWELERHNLHFLDILDEGQFGLVWRCKLRQAELGERTVAVKTLKNSTSKDERGREELLAEIEIMKLVCQHPNVVKILHCCTSDAVCLGNDVKPILLVMEYAELGKLQSFLEKSRINHNYATNLYNNIHATSDHLTSRDLVKFIYHVAKGMEYISSECIVHRDLASRNILVSTERICKIGDFGMARHMQSSSGIYERHSRNAKVPVRWMAPEVLLENKFTTKSDVFSFGILMWEIVTLGSTPYQHLKTEQVIDHVARQGERPGKPEYCHEQLYRIMSQCWDHDPSSRPTFGRLIKQLDELLLSADDYIELDQYPDHNYCNIPGSAAPHELL